MKVSYVSIIFIFVCLIFVYGQTEEPKVKYAPLLKPGEEVLISFQIKKSKKIVTVAIAKNKEYIVYRFGNKEKIELEFPDDKRNSWQKFIYSFFSVYKEQDNAGVDFNHLTFTNTDCTYCIYDEYTLGNNKDKIFEKFEIGILVTDNKSGKKVNIEGDYQSKIGDLSRLRLSEKMKVINELAQ